MPVAFVLWLMPSATLGYDSKLAVSMPELYAATESTS
jgi:hypothetical protein